ncbi:hypothetical protein EV192_10455 [Actinocrispum wychmicini]|uniref:Uncharacterized protein n=1 Tax=Actinocrispum wychmicini TaxID=1213861 RepID=A0A4R2JYM5_9PSEU|nr:hypothetical protein EV192_10455 [Actinocrispum wychmicini]
MAGPPIPCHSRGFQQLAHGTGLGQAEVVGYPRRQLPVVFRGLRVTETAVGAAEPVTGVRLPDLQPSLVADRQRLPQVVAGPTGVVHRQTVPPEADQDFDSSSRVPAAKTVTAQVPVPPDRRGQPAGVLVVPGARRTAAPAAGRPPAPGHRRARPPRARRNPVRRAILSIAATEPAMCSARYLSSPVRLAVQPCLDFAERSELDRHLVPSDSR